MDNSNNEEIKESKKESNKNFKNYEISRDLGTKRRDYEKQKLSFYNLIITIIVGMIGSIIGVLKANFIVIDRFFIFGILFLIFDLVFIMRYIVEIYDRIINSLQQLEDKLKLPFINELLDNKKNEKNNTLPYENVKKEKEKIYARLDGDGPKYFSGENILFFFFLGVFLILIAFFRSYIEVFNNFSNHSSGFLIIFFSLIILSYFLSFKAWTEWMVSLDLKKYFKNFK